MNVQRAELLERLSTAHKFCNLDDEDNYIAASKAVRQVRGMALKIKYNRGVRDNFSSSICEAALCSKVQAIIGSIHVFIHALLLFHAVIVSLLDCRSSIS